MVHISSVDALSGDDKPQDAYGSSKDAMSKPHDLYFCLPDAINKAPRNQRRDK